MKIIDLQGSFFKKMAYTAAVNCLIAAAFFGFGENKGVSVLTGAMLSSIFVLSSAWILDRFKEADSRLFIKVFFFSMGLRFLLVLILFGFLLAATKIDEIYFTVSFIISYLCQSVTEMIFINKILQKSDTQRK